ncbi:hypothetical protein [Dietzia sp. 179-F 9C3 NHS]|uniref:hypothetical protein n=1 Tax=Dietzia sp. 179-F 9C3 NHS TaxID=3374295 RepID=UPI0038795D6D
MSVTFFPETAPIVGYRLADYFGGRDDRVFATYGEAVDALVAARKAGTILPGCTDPEAALCCSDVYRIDIVTADGDDEGPEVNVANTNARELLALLGYAEDGVVHDLYGSEDADAFLGRVLTAVALSPVDEGVPATVNASAGGVTIIDCGRAPGYVQARLAALEELARWCRDRQRRVCWA